MNPTDCLKIVTLVGDTDKAQMIFELIEKNYGRNVQKEEPERIRYVPKIIGQ